MKAVLLLVFLCTTLSFNSNACEIQELDGAIQNFVFDQIKIDGKYEDPKNLRVENLSRSIRKTDTGYKAFVTYQLTGRLTASAVAEGIALSILEFDSSCKLKKDKGDSALLQGTSKLLELK